MNRLIALFTAVLLFTALHSQKPLYTHQQWFKVEDGLPQSFVSDVAQDDDGFIWISTLDGLTRYDGRSFRVFRPKEGDSNSLSSNVIYHLIHRLDNNFWLVYQGAPQPDIFNPRTMKVSRPMGAVTTARHNQSPINFENNARFWSYLPGDGIAWLEPHTQKKIFANRKNGLLKDDSVIGSVQDPQGHLWLLSRFSIQVSDESRSHFSYKPFAQPLPPELSERAPVQLALLSGNRIAVASRSAIWVLHLNDGSYKRMPVEISRELHPGLKTLRKGPDGRLYIKARDQILRLEDDESLTVLWENNLLPKRRMTAMLIDKSETLWVGIDAGGLVKINLRSMPLNAMTYVNNFHTDILEKLGLPKNKMPAEWLTGPWSYSFRYAYAPDSSLYICSNETAANSAQVYKYRNGNLSELPFPTTKSIVLRGLSVDEHGEIRALDNHNRGIWHWKDERSMPSFIPCKFPEGLMTALADLVHWKGSSWITSSGKGLFRFIDSLPKGQYDKKSGDDAVPYDLTSMCKDPLNQDILWIGSLGGGLIQWNIQTGLQRIFTAADGLPNNTIYSILPDKLNKIWLSTNKGIARFDTKTFDVQNFEKHDGLPGNEFNRSHQFLFPDGRIAFGGMDGYVIFQPANFSLRNDTISPPIQFTEILINNQALETGAADGILKSSLNETKELILPHNKNFITASFAALQYNEPQKIKYRYRLKGLSEDWIETGSNNTAHYTQLRPGSYLLEVMATNLDGKWSKSLRQLKIQVLPPLWATWWAYTTYALLAIGIFFLYWRYREKRLKEKQQLIYEHREAERLRDLDLVKSRFFSNITHEFRTPLTLITTPLEKIHNDPSLSSPVKQTIHTVQRNTKRLLALINQLLDLSKLEAGQMQLYLSAGNLAAFIKECVLSFSNGAAEKNIKLNFDAVDPEAVYRFDEEKWAKIITNLISNALKFTPVGGVINVTLERIKEGNIMCLHVQDNGPGISTADQQKIFERFYQADSSSTRSYEGTGIGLSLVKELTKLMHGTVRVQSKPGAGALFIVEIPVEKLSNGKLEEVTGAAPVMIHHAALPTPEKSGPLILVAEDNEELRAFIAESLSDKWKVIQAADGIMAWDLILSEMPDLVVSDVMMPGRDGLELCTISKSDPRSAHISFILLTARSAHAGKIEGLEKGADNYLTKPFHLDELELSVQNLLQSQENLRNYLQSQLLPSVPHEQPAAVSNPFLQELYEVLDRRLDDSQLSVETLASEMNMSRSSLNRKLKNLLDISANDLIRRYRLQKAATMLSEGIDISTVAYRSGFSSPSYFAQCFKDQYNLTPSAYSSGQRLTQN